jgi:hypothetical protein
MKITKSQLKQIIKEETAAVLSEGEDWYDDNHETMADRKFADRPEDPDSDADDAAELQAGIDLAGFELIKDRGYYVIIDKESGERVLGPFRTEKEAGARAMRSDTRSEFEASQDVLNKLGPPGPTRGMNRNEYMWHKSAEASPEEYKGHKNPFKE